MESFGTISGFLPLLFLFFIFYVLIVRPQQKQAKQHKEMLNELRKGDKIVTNGGIFGEVSKVEDGFIMLRVSENTTIKLDKNFILKKVDIKTLEKEENK